MHRDMPSPRRIPRRVGTRSPGRLDDQAIRTYVETAIGAATAQPARRSEILGEAAMRLSSLAHHKDHAAAAPLLIELAEQFARAAMESETPATTDDFHELLEEQKAARDDGFSDDLNIRARSEATHDAGEKEVTPRVSIAPASWGKGATLGRSGTFRYAPTSQDVDAGIQQSATLAFWQGQPHESQALSIDLSLVALPMPIGVLPAPSPGIDVSARPYGIVTYGSDGAIVSVRFDAGFGTRFNVSGSYVSIVAGMQAPMTGVAPGTLSFSASIGAFASPSQAPVTLTEYLDALPNGATSAPIQRPQHASQILPVLSSSTAGTALLTFYGQGAGGALLSFSYPIGQLLQPIPLPSEVQYVTLKNLTGQAANFRLMFQLSL